MIVFSQYGEIVDCRIVRDKESGKSKGFGFICYEDQRSTILAVDNLNGANICGKVIRVDHVEQFKIPREYLEVEELDEKGERRIYKPSGPDGRGWGEDRILNEQDVNYFQELRRIEEEREMRMSKLDQTNYVMDQDEQWEQMFVNLVNQEKEAEDKIKQEKRERKKMKKEKKEKKKEKKRLKELKRKQKEEQEIKELKKTYGIEN